jgi:hemerythrin
MAILDLDAIPQVALPFMNVDHRESARLLNALGDAILAFRAGVGSASAVLDGLEAVDAHLRAHFVREEAAMQRTGFPPCPVHKAEHDHVLTELAAETRCFRDRRNVDRLWAYASQAVPAWLVGHVESIDHVTAGFIAAREHGEVARRPERVRQRLSRLA